MIQNYWKFIEQQLKTVGARLMMLYIMLLLVPIIGIGIYGHLYIQGTLTQNAIQLGLDEIAVRAMTIDTMLSQIHDDILYLEQRIEVSQTFDVASRDPTLELTGLAASHPIYRFIGWLDNEGNLLGGHLSDGLAAWAAGEDFQVISTLEPNTIRFLPLRSVNNTGEAILLAGVRLDNGVLLFDINTAYLMQNLSVNDEGWALLIRPNTLLTLSENLALGELGIEQMTDTNGYVTVGDLFNLYHSTGPGGTWAIIHSIPKTALEADLVQYYTTFFIIVIGGLTSVVGLALLSIARIIGPVYQLEEMVDQLRQGTARPSLPHHVPEDEFGKLMSTFDQMAAELEQKRRTERALIEQLIRAQEEERKIIAYDLHDGLIQELVGARFYLGEIRNNCTELFSEQSRSFLLGYDILSHAIVEGRRIIQGLHPTVLEDLGLEAALIELGKMMAQTASWEINVDIEPLNTPLDRATSVTLYRIAQEALNNAFKHASAKHVDLKLSITEDHQLKLIVRDDGCGFNPNAVFQNGGQHWGIKTMRERATMLRGTCTFTSSPDQGTTVEVIIPYEKETVE